jgi:galactose mutarotase-like enzyme
MEPSSSPPPSGTQYEIKHAGQRATVVEVGGALREYVVDGHAVLDGFPVDTRADGGRGQPLLPWPNRILDGVYEFDGQRLQLPIEEVERHNAMHGLTRWQNWSLVERAAKRVRLALTIHPRPGYPFTLALALEYALDDRGLLVRTIARNAGVSPLPFGAGQHPYLSVGTPRVDEATLRLAASHRLEMDPERLVPTGVLLATAVTDYDFRVPRRIGDCVLDDCFTDLARDDRGRAEVTLSDPGSGWSVTLWMGTDYRYTQIFTGDTLAQDRRRQGLAIEPMTCPPNAFRTGTDLVVLGPGESITLEWGVTSTRTHAATEAQ